MRILLWYWGRRGGGAQFAVALAGALVRRPDVALGLSVARAGHLTEAFRGLGTACQVVDTFTGPLGAALGLARLPALAAALIRQARHVRAEVVVSAMTHPWTPLIAPRLARAGLAYVPIIHDAAPHPGDDGRLWDALFDWRLDRELRAARAAVALSGPVAAALRARAPALPLIRLEHGVNLPDCHLAPRAPGAGFRFLFLGRLRAYKGLDLLRDAFRQVRTTHPDATLHVAGEGALDALAPGLRTTPGVTVSDRWLPESAIPRLLAAADAVVLPYREASQSGVAPLALAAGLPVVATPVGGLAEQVADGLTGLLAASVTPAALAAAMRAVMDPARHAVLAAGAAAAGQRLADWDAPAAALVDGLRARGLGGA